MYSESLIHLFKPSSHYQEVLPHQSVVEPCFYSNIKNEKHIWTLFEGGNDVSETSRSICGCVAAVAVIPELLQRPL